MLPVIRAAHLTLHYASLDESLGDLAIGAHQLADAIDDAGDVERDAFRAALPVLASARKRLLILAGAVARLEEKIGERE